jgi:Ca2+-binding RTX toxin-like protein
VLFAAGGDDTLIGDTGNDLMFGGSGDDRLRGDDGVVDNDRLNGGPNVAGDVCESDPDPETGCEV